MLQVCGPVVVRDSDKATWIAAGRRLQDAGITHINITAPPDAEPMQALPRIIEARHALAYALPHHQ